MLPRSIPVQSKKTVQTEGKTGMPKQSSSLKLAGLDIMDSTHAGAREGFRERSCCAGDGGRQTAPTIETR
eukprot:1859804-Rhodomonas_salina.4